MHIHVQKLVRIYKHVYIHRQVLLIPVADTLVFLQYLQKQPVVDTAICCVQFLEMRDHYLFNPTKRNDMEFH